MDFSTWDACFNVLLLIFWMRIWSRDPREEVFNPYLASTGRFSSSILSFLRPAFLMLPDRIVAVIGMVLIFALRAFAAPRTHEGWVLRLGFEARQAYEGSLTPFLAFTVLSFAIFLFKIWSVSLIYLREDANASVTSHTHSALYAACRPFMAIPYPMRPLFLLAFGITIAIAMNLTGYPSEKSPQFAGQMLAPATPVLASPLLWQCFVSAIGGWVSVLATLEVAVFYLIIASLAGLLLGSHGISHTSREWTDMLIGPLRRFPMQIGMLDLTPLVFIFAVRFIHTILQAFLLGHYLRIVPGA